MFIIGLIFDAAIIGIIIAAMEKGEWPGWGPTIGCVLVIGIAGNATAHFLPGYAALLGFVVAAGVGALMIAWLCEMTLKRAAIAAGIYLGIRLGLTLFLMVLFDV